MEFLQILFGGVFYYIIIIIFYYYDDDNAKFARSEELPKRPAKPAAQRVKLEVLVISI